jgi:hypothetical protein
MTASIVSFRTGRPVAPGHVAVLAEILTRDGCRCAHCRAQGGAVVQYGELERPRLLCRPGDAGTGQYIARIAVGSTAGYR